MSCLFVEQARWGRKLNIGDDGYEKIDFVENFRFCFYGTTYSSTYVNANGNITFNQGDGDFSPSFVEFINAPNPRIAPYWIDLDPRYSGPNGGIFVNQLDDAFVVTWAELPYYFGSQHPPINTLQLIICKNGVIGMAYDTLDNTFPAGDASPSYPLVGIAKGSGQESAVFKYDAGLNQDVAETVRGPIGLLNNSQIFFLPTRDGYDLIDRLIYFKSCVTIPCGFRLDPTRAPQGALNSACKGQIYFQKSNIELYNSCENGYIRVPATCGIGCIELNLAVPILDQDNNTPTYTCETIRINLNKLLCVGNVDELDNISCAEFLKKITIQELVIGEELPDNCCHGKVYEVHGCLRLNACCELEEPII